MLDREPDLAGGRPFCDVVTVPRSCFSRLRFCRSKVASGVRLREKLDLLFNPWSDPEDACRLQESVGMLVAETLAGNILLEEIVARLVVEVLMSEVLLEEVGVVELEGSAGLGVVIQVFLPSILKPEVARLVGNLLLCGEAFLLNFLSRSFTELFSSTVLIGMTGDGPESFSLPELGRLRGLVTGGKGIFTR